MSLVVYVFDRSTTAQCFTGLAPLALTDVLPFLADLFFFLLLLAFLSLFSPFVAVWHSLVLLCLFSFFYVQIMEFFMCVFYMGLSAYGAFHLKYFFDVQLQTIIVFINVTFNLL